MRIRRKVRIKREKFTTPCPGALNIEGAHYSCEEAIWPHRPLACHNAEIGAIWTTPPKEDW